MAVKKVQKKIGRPSKFKEEYCDMLYIHMKSGLSFQSFGGEVDVCIDTLHKWEKRYPAFADAKKKGQGACLKFWESIGRNGTIGKIPNFNCAAWIFNMKNRFGWRDRQEVEHTGESGKIFIHVDGQDKDV